ncbi:STAS domain-containing protein [Streptomyces sp. NPDC127049]|uniref:STAS domain-containing protein n=1 Tax=Streptomyces sp. NPDC127049 TaxID=3347118 RepID=UPI0036610DF9
MTLFFEPADAVEERPRTGAERCEVSVATGPDAVSVTVRGALDMECVDRLRIALLQAITTGARAAELRVDLTGVTFCDSTGLNELLRAHRRALGEHRRMTVTGISDQVERLMKLTGTCDLFGLKR